MKRLTIFLLFSMVFAAFLFAGLEGCQKKGAPSTPLDTSFTPTPTQVAQVPGPLKAAVEDKGLAVPGLTVYAIPPTGAPTYTATTAYTGIATFNPSTLEVGTWTFVVPAQTPFPYAPSTVTLPVTQSGEQADFNTAGASLELTAPVPSAISGPSGGIFVYGLSYDQGSLLVPVTLEFSSMPTNWSVAYSPATIGYLQNDTASVTVTGSGCVDEPATFTVTGLDQEPTPYPRATSVPQIIAKDFTSQVTVTWSQSNFTNYTSCNLEKQASGTLKISSTNSCAEVSVWLGEPSTSCTSGSFNTPNGNTNAKGGVITFGPGTYSCSYLSDGGFPTIHAVCSSNGASGNVQVGNGNFTVLSTGY